VVALKRHWLIAVSMLILLLDLLTKHLVRTYGPDISLLPFLSITYITNTGGAFGIFQGYNWFFVLVALMFLALIILYYKRIPAKPAYILPLGLLAGGAAGNLLDRIVFGKVTDFISLSFFPAFNIADSSLTVGALALGAILLRSEYGSSLGKGRNQVGKPKKSFSTIK